MARIRSIKPDYWTDEKVVEMSPWERLLFIGIWNFCDDQGYIDDKPRRIKMQVFPGDDMSVAEIEKMVGNLVLAGFLDEYESPIGPVLHVRNWERHQRVDRPSTPRFEQDSLVARRVLGEPSMDVREVQNALPSRRSTFIAVTEPIFPKKTGTEDVNSDNLPANSTSPRRALDEPSRPSLDAEGKGREGKGKEGITTSSTSSPKRARTTDDPDFDHFWTAYPRKEAKGAARKAWKTALTKTTVPKLIAAAAAYRDRTSGQENRFIAMPATWLNGERWDDQTATRTRQVGSATGGAFWDN